MLAPRARRGTPFDAAERRSILDRHRRAWEAADAAEDAGDDAALRAARAELAAAAAAYVDGCPIVPVSRSPHSGQLFVTSLDTFDLDGLWWASEYEHRPPIAPPPDLLGWTGAMRLDGPLAHSHLQTMVGPDVPFVIPRLLEHPSVVAVVSAVRVGPHVGYPIAYFAEPMVHGIERVDDWAHFHHILVGPDGRARLDHAVQHDADRETELGPWLRSGRLRWIAPGDDAFVLRSGEAGCPYAELEGHRRLQYVREGRVDTY